MTDQQINQAIAEACGIVGKDQYGPLYQTPEGWVVDCPQFATCLNAMAEALKTLPPDQLWDVAYSLPMETMLGFMATARELAETFLMVIGKWEPTTEESAAVQSTSFGGSGGAPAHGGKGLGIAGGALPPETRITVNGKTFCLADIDKEMTE